MKNILKKKFLLVVLLAFVTLVGCNKTTTNQETTNVETNKEIVNENAETNNEDSTEASLENMSFEEIKELAKGTTVNFYGYGGDVLRNEFIDNTFIPYAKEHYDINVNRVPMDIEAINNLLLNEKQAGQPSAVDVIWING